ncbi:MAG: conserved repeat domain protein [Chitinophagaceae bacterium]|nr:conserved repeat domain protein [Chitinophagaceae bacterium]
MKKKLRSIGMALLLCLVSFFAQAQTITLSSTPQTVLQYGSATAFQLQVSTTAASDGNFNVALPAGMHVVDVPTFSGGTTPVTITYDQYNNTSFQFSFTGLLPAQPLAITYFVRAGCNVSQFSNVSLTITDLTSPEVAVVQYNNTAFDITLATASYTVLPLISNNPDPIPLNINDPYSWDYEIIGGNDGVPFTGVLRFDDVFRSGINITGIEFLLNGTMSLPFEVIEQNPTHQGSTTDGSVSYFVNLNNFSNTDHLIIREYGQVMNCLKSSERIGGVGLSSIAISYGPFLGNYCGSFTTTRNIIDAGNNPDMVRTADNLSRNNAGFDYDAFASSTCFTTTGTPGNVKHRVVTYTNNGSSASMNTLFRMVSQTVDINVLVDANSLKWKRGSDVTGSTYAIPPVANADFNSDWTNPDQRDVFITVIPKNNCMINSRTLALARYTINFGTVAAGETITVEWDEYYCCPNDDQLSQNFRPLNYACYYTNECGSHFATDFAGGNSNALRGGQVMEPIAQKNMEGNGDADITSVDGEQQIIRIKDKTFLLQEFSSVFLAENAFIDIDFLTECGLSWNTGGKDNGDADRYDIQFASRDGSVLWLPVINQITGSDLMPAFTIPNDATYTTAFGWRARFSITDLATQYGWTTPDEIGTGLQAFLREAELSFNVRARCDCHPGPTTHFIEKMYLVPQYAPSCETCRLPFYQIGNYINVTCVGCKTPGISIDAPVILERAGQNVGLADTDDNGIPDDFITPCNDPTIPAGQQCNLKLATLNDIMHLQVAGNFSDGELGEGYEYSQLLSRPDPIALNYFYYQVQLPTSHFNSIGNAAGGSGISVNKNDIKISLTEDAGSAAITGSYTTYISRASSTAYAVYDWTTPFPDDVLTLLLEIPRSSFVLGTNNTQYQTDATSPHLGGRSIVNVDLNFTIANALAGNYKEISLKFLMYLSDRTGIFEGIAPDVSCKGKEDCVVIPLNDVQHGSLFWCRRGEGTFNYNPRFTDATLNPVDALNCQKQITYANLISVAVDGGQAYDLFPNEYRDLGHMGSIQFRIPPGYSISAAQMQNGYNYNQVEVTETVNLVPEDLVFDAATNLFTYTPVYEVPQLSDFTTTSTGLQRIVTLNNTSTVKNATTVMDEFNNRILTITMRPACGADAPYIPGDVTTTPGYSAHMTLIKGSGPIVLKNGVNNYSQNNYDSEITARASDFTFHAPSDNLSLTYSSSGGQELTVFDNSTSFQIRFSNIDVANLAKSIDASNAYLEFNGLDPSLQITSITRLINGVPTAAIVDPQHANRYLLGTILEGETIDYTVTLAYNCGLCDVSQLICLDNNFTIGYNWSCNGDQPCGTKDPLPFHIKSVRAGLSLAQAFSNLNLCSNNIGYDVTVTSSQQGVVNGFQYTTTLPVGVTYRGNVSTNIANVVTTTNTLGQQVLSWTDINPAFSLNVKENHPTATYSFNLQSTCIFINNQPVFVKATALTYCASTTTSTKTDNITLALGTAIISQDDITVGTLDCSNTATLVVPLTIHGSVLYSNTVVVQLATGVSASSVSNGGVYNATAHTVTWTIDPSFVYASPGLSVNLVNNTIQTASNNIITFTQPRQARCGVSGAVCDITPVVKTYACPACINTPVLLSANLPGFCPGGSVVLTANSISGAVYQWYKDGQPIANPTNTSLTVTLGGAYTIKCTNLFLCNPNSNTVNITAYPRLPLQLSPVGQSLAVCKDGSLTLTAVPTTYQTYYWRKAGALIAVTSVPSLTVNGSGITSPTLYTVDVLGNADGCAASAGTTLTPAPVPAVTIAPAGPISICPSQTTNTLTAHVTPATPPSGSSYNYQWFLNGNALPASNAATINAIVVGSYTVKVTETTNVASCGVMSIPVVVEMRDPSIEFGGLSCTAVGKFCLYNTVQIININNTQPKPGVTYTWNYGPGAIPATSTGFVPSSSLIYNSVGIKTVTLTITDNGCPFTLCVLKYEITDCGSCPINATRTLGNPATTTILQTGNFNGTYHILGDLVFETGTFTFNPGTVFYVEGKLNWSPCTNGINPTGKVLPPAVCCADLTMPVIMGTITIRNGANLVMNNARITSACSVAWHGLAVDNRSNVTIKIDHSEISNSEKGLFDLYVNPIVNNKTFVRITNSKFINNAKTSINFDNGFLTMGGNSYITNNDFSWRLPAVKPFNSLVQSTKQILLTGDYSNMPISNNTFVNSNVGLEASFSIVNIKDNTFSENTTAILTTNNQDIYGNKISVIENNAITIPDPAANTFTYGISASGNFKITHNSIIGRLSKTTGTINNQVGIVTIPFNGELSYNTISGTDAAIVPYQSNVVISQQDPVYLITNNTITNARYGIAINTPASPTTNLRITCNRFLINRFGFVGYGIYIYPGTKVNAQGSCSDPNNLPVSNAFNFTGLGSLNSIFNGNAASNFVYNIYLNDGVPPNIGPNVTVTKCNKISNPFTLCGGHIGARFIEGANVSETEEELSTAASLGQNIPNPFTESTSIPYYVPEGSVDARLMVYENVTGHVIEEVKINEVGAGSITFAADRFASGMYLYTLVINGEVIGQKKMVIMK